MVSTARIITGIPGRTRIRISGRKGDGDYFAAVREKLLKCGGVRDVTVNPAIGSVLILHEGEFAAIARYGQEAGLFSVTGEDAGRKAAPLYVQATLGAYRAVDERLKRLTGGEIGLAGASFLALAGTGIYQIARGKLGAPAWYTAFWYALNIFLKTRSRADAAESSRS